MRLCSRVSVGKAPRTALTSEKVHEVLGHIAVGREDLADAGGALGPWLARRALDSVGHPLQQALTCEGPECGHRQQSPSAPSSQKRTLRSPASRSMRWQQGRSPAGLFCRPPPPPTLWTGPGLCCHSLSSEAC